MFESVALGINRLVDGKDNDVATFIGTMICHDDNARAVVGERADPLGGQVYVVIDGQQRLTLLMTASALLHDRIRIGMARGKVSDWLAKKCRQSIEIFDEYFRV